MALAGSEQRLGEVHRARRFLDCVDDRRVAGAAAEVPGEHVDDLVARRRAAREEIGRRHEDPGRAEPALERVVAPERLLQRREARRARERLHGRDGRPVGLHGEQAAAAHRDAVEEHRARAADAVLAADVRPRQTEPVAKEVGQQQTRLDRLSHRAPVDRELDLDHRARSTARRTSVPVRDRR